MKYYYDLHIHSVLSPDADVLMTPNNIFNMAWLKKLEIIAITDHNHTGQLIVCQELAKSYDFLVVPGIELSLLEGFHVLCYFMNFEDAYAFNQAIERWRNKSRYDEDELNTQAITDLEDHIIDYYSFNLSLPLTLSYYELLILLKSYRHILVFAHLNRSKHSGLDYLNIYRPHAIELSQSGNKHFIEDHKLSHYQILYNSDAHSITDINERGELNSIELDSLTIEAFFKHFNG